MKPEKLEIAHYLFIFTILLILSIVWFTWIGKPDFPLDDAYIVQSTVNSFAHDAPLRFENSNPLIGATSIVHILLISITSFIIPTEWAQIFWLVVAIMFYIFAVYKFSMISGVKSEWALVISALSILSGLSLYHVLNGLETGLAMAAVTWSAVLFINPLPKDIRHFILLGVLPFIRPELAILSVVLYLRALWYLRGSIGANKIAITATLWPLLSAICILAIIFVNGHSALPNTLSAKSYFFAEGCLPFIDKSKIIISGISSFILSMGAASLGYLALTKSKIKFVFILFGILFITAYFIKLPGALFHNWHRYLYLLAPFAIMGWSSWLSSERPSNRTIGKILLLIALIQSCLGIRQTWELYLDGLNISRTELASTSAWVNSNLPHDKAIMVHDAGYISLSGVNPLIDIVGLKTPSSIDIHKLQTWSFCARNAIAIDQIARRGNASYFIVLDTWDQLFGLTQSLRLTGWQVVRVDTIRGSTIYKIYRIQPPRH